MDDTLTAYKWLDTQDMKPESKNDPEAVFSRNLMSKLLNMFDLD